jgi:DNA-binding CsgD family transcriptional regulator
VGGGLMQADRWPLLGRDGERVAIADALDADPSRSVVVTGPPGVGRTRLAREALRHAEACHRPTRWAVGTAAAGRMPFGALAHLLPGVDAATDPVVLLQRAAHAVAGDGPERSVVLGVDDVHLLDPLSLTLLHHLAVAGVVTLVLTVRTDPVTPDPTTPLWKDGLAARLELHPLVRADLDRLAGEALDGDVETRTGETLWRLSQGTPLYFRELVEHGLRTGRLRASGGLWRWDGPMAPSERLRHIVLAQIGDLDAGEWKALDVLVTGEPVSVDQVVDLASQDAVAGLERRGLITVDDSGGSSRVRVSQPLYAEVVRSRASEAALRLIRTRLTGGSAEAASPDELLRRCSVEADGDVPAPTRPLLVQAARQAIAMLDHPRAERLARACIRAGGGAGVYLSLIEATYWQGDPEAGERLAIEGARWAVTDEDRARLTAARALALFCGLGRAEDATTLLAQAAGTVRGEEARVVLVATEAMLSVLGGDPARAVEQATSVLSSATGGGVARPLAAAAAAAGLALTGETGRASATARVGWEALETLPEAAERGFARIALAQAEIMALYLSGRFAELDRRAAELYRRNLTLPEWAGDAVACLHRGWAALACGRPRLAIRWLNEALVGFEERDPTGMRRICVAQLARAKALAGDIAGARELLCVDDRTPPPAIRAFDPHVCLSRAWVAAAEGRTADAGRLALDAARLAAEQGQWAVEASMLHSALSFDRAADVVNRLRDLAERLDSPFAVHFAAYAEATVARSAERLEAVSRAFEDGSALLPAADAAAQAAAVHERAGDRRAAAAAAARAMALAREGGLVETPALGVLSPSGLTAREREVAHLASGGLTNLEIADRLVLSVRTVEAHLAHVYTKLGINGRPRLSDALQQRTSPLRRRPVRDDGAPPAHGRRISRIGDR